MSTTADVLEVLTSQPGVPVGLDEFEHLGFMRNRAATILANNIRRPIVGTEWEDVRRVGVGVYVFDPLGQHAPSSGWTEVTRGTGGVVVLRDGDGALYAARPLDVPEPL